MTGILFSILLLVHALLHLVGVSGKRSGTQVGQPLALRLLWLLAALLFFLALVCRLAQTNWWYWAAAGVVVSQSVIITRWREAKAGTAINVLVVIAVLLAAAQHQFRNEAYQQARALIPETCPPTRPVTDTQIARLPPVVQHWLRSAGVASKPVPACVRLRQGGRMRLKPTSEWVPVVAEQYFTTATPSFVWLARVGKSPAYFAGSDVYRDGHGQMTIKIMSVIPVADATGPEADQGTMLRYLAEIQWFPAAAVNPYIHWRQTSPNTAMAIMTYGGITDSGQFRFGANGDVMSFEAMRYMNDNGTWHLRKWTVPVTRHAVMNGIRIPVTGRTIWQMPEGDFNWFEWTIDQIDYNNQNRYN